MLILCALEVVLKQPVYAGSEELDRVLQKTAVCVRKAAGAVQHSVPQRHLSIAVLELTDSVLQDTITTGAD